MRAGSRTGPMRTAYPVGTPRLLRTGPAAAAIRRYRAAESAANGRPGSACPLDMPTVPLAATHGPADSATGTVGFRRSRQPLPLPTDRSRLDHRPDTDRNPRCGPPDPPRDVRPGRGSGRKGSGTAPLPPGPAHTPRAPAAARCGGSGSRWPRAGIGSSRPHSLHVWSRPSSPAVRSPQPARPRWATLFRSPPRADVLKLGVQELLGTPTPAGTAPLVGSPRSARPA